MKDNLAPMWKSLTPRVDAALDRWLPRESVEPKLLHRVVLGSGPVCRSTIVAAGGRLYVRTADTLYCISKGEAK